MERRTKEHIKCVIRALTTPATTDYFRLLLTPSLFYYILPLHPTTYSRFIVQCKPKQWRGFTYFPATVPSKDARQKKNFSQFFDQHHTCRWA
ncbi:hypothetical protein [Phocaeicola sp.]